MQSGISGRSNASQNYRTSCKKCGYTGHLTFQCRNFLNIDPDKDVMLDVSSTSSESEEEQFVSPLLQAVQKNIQEENADKKQHKAKKRKHKSRSRSRSRDDKKRKSSHKEKDEEGSKRKSDHKKKQKKHDESDSDSESDSSHDKHKRHHHRKRSKKSSKHKKH